MATRTDQAGFRNAVRAVPGFVYHNGLRLTALSLAWTLAAIPLVTIGPATLAAYVIVQDLRSDRNRIDRGRLVAVLRKNGPASVLFSGVPVAFGLVTVAYGTASLNRASLAGEAIALVALYIALYAALTLMPTFTALARGADPVDALGFGLGWLRAHPGPALAMGLLSLLVLVVTLLLTIAFPLLFASLVFSLQVAIVETVDGRAARPDVNGAAAVH